MVAIEDHDPWVVTYEYVYDDHDPCVGEVSVHTTVEFFRGSEQECRRIAAHSVAPTRYDGKKVVAFRPLIGLATDWERHLRELDEAFADE